MEPTIDQIIAALKCCAVEEPQGGHPCDGCYLYPLSKEGYMSTGRTCFEHLTLDAIASLQSWRSECGIAQQHYDQWKAFGDALMRAARKHKPNDGRFACFSCALGPSKKCGDCRNGKHWQFDEARFKEKGATT